MVEICRDINGLESFCRHICKKLECCPNLISPHHYNENCPENCDQLTKTKYSECVMTNCIGKELARIKRPE